MPERAASGAFVWFGCERPAIGRKSFGEAAGRTEAMFAEKDKIGIWFHSEKGYYVSELDAALDSEAYAEEEHRS